VSATARWIGRIVGYCSEQPWIVAVTGVILAAFCAFYTVTHFAMNSDTGQLISSDLAWRQRAAVYDAAFPQNGDSIVAVVDGKTPELAELGASRLTAALSRRADLFPQVTRPDGGPFFDKNGLLFQSTAEVKTTTDKMITAQPFLGSLAADPSLRGLASSLSTALQGVSADQAKLKDLQPAMRSLSDTLDQVVSGKRAYFSWRKMFTGSEPAHREFRRMVVIRPRLDFSRLEPGENASRFIRATAQELQLDQAHGLRVRLTGQIPLRDEEFGSLTERAGLVATLMLSAIVLMLWFAVRSVKLIGCIILTTFAGLAFTAAIGLIIFGRFNVISVAFIPLFVGLGVDFGIQFSVRYRAEQLEHEGVHEALVASGQGVGRSLMLAAIAIASGFFAFLPTSYSGVSQLGAVAGMGMIIALILNLTVLPAFIQIVKPTGRLREVGYAELAPVDAYLVKHRRMVLVIGASAAAVGILLMPFVRFDFNPLHMRSYKVESMATLNELMSDPDQSPNTIEVLEPDLASADQLAKRLAKLPDVDRVVTLSSFVPKNQSPKLATIQDASTLLDLTLNPFDSAPPPSDAELATQLRQTSQDLRAAAIANPGPGAAEALRLSTLFGRLADGPPSLRSRATDALIPGLGVMLDQLRNSLQAGPVSLQGLPPDLVSSWISRDGRARIDLLPRGNPNDNEVLKRFTREVSNVAPEAVGTPINIQEAGATVAGSFIEAGALSFVAITLLLFWVLRRPKDVAVTMTPIILTGLLTLGTCVLIGQPLNYANIIAFPLLFGIGVAFHIYFVMAWRAGGSHLLESSLARAVFFSALTTATGFGSLWASSHPGTASMGKLLMISLVWTLATALIFQPALMGKPRDETVPL
jgi:hopanoid biosynthesis associated RND transporter like protein HpnN